MEQSPLSFLLALCRLIVIGLLIVLLMPVQALILIVSPKSYSWLPIHFHRMLCWIAGIEIEVKGKISHKRPTLFIANHSSYLDIIVLSTLLPVSFVAKAEIASWPLFGWLAKLQKTVFINRRRSDAKQHIDQVGTALNQGQNLVIFPEGTSSDHNRVLPFKPTLLRAADTQVQNQYVPIQPVCISFVGVNSLPVGRYERPLYAWYGDMDLVPHLWKLLGLGRIQMVVEFFPILSRENFASHKDLALHCRNQISSAHSGAINGRPPQDVVVALPAMA